MSDASSLPPPPRPRTPARRLAGWLAIAAVVLVLLVWWIRFALERSNPPVTFDLIGFEQTTATSVDVRFRVQRENEVDVVCVLRARDLSGAEVGRREVAIPAGAGHEVDLVETVRTTGPAISADVLGCGLPRG